MSKRTITFDKGTIRFDFFKSMSLTAVLFMAILFFCISIVFLFNSFTLKSEDSVHQLNYISGQLEYYLTSANNYSKTVISNTSVQKYMSECSSLSEPPVNKLEIQEQICQIIQTTSFIHSVQLFSADGSFLLATESFTQPEDLSQPVQSPTWSTGIRTKVGSRNEEIKVLSYTRPFYEISSGRIIGYMDISIPESAISKIYTDQSGQQNIFMIDSRGTVQSTSGSPSLDTDFSYAGNILDSKGSGYFFAGSNFIFYTNFQPLDWYIVSQIPIAMFLHSIILLFCISLLVAALIMAVCVYVSQKTAQRISWPLSQLSSHMQRVQDGQWSTAEEVPCNNETASLIRAFNNMIVRQTQLRDDLVESEKHKRQLSLSLLQEQINPHFLYNTLDNICSLAELDEKASLIRLTMNLSSFYRLCLSSGKMHITVGQELNIARYYLEIMGVRYYNKFDYSISCPENLKDCQCIKLLLQPVIENSIYHGIKELSRFGHISIQAEDMDSCIRFTVKDNGKGLEASDLDRIWTESSRHFGIRNIHQRIQLYYGEPYGLTISSPEDGGCITTITLPKEVR